MVRGLFLILGWAIFSSGGFVGSVSATSEDSFIKLKVAYLFNFPKFTTWPESRLIEENSDLLFCIYKDAMLARPLKALSASKLENHTLQVVLIDNDTAIESCHLLIIDKNNEEKILLVKNQLEKKGILLITDEISGGIIMLEKYSDTVKFSVNLKYAKDCSFKFSAALLKLARTVDQ